MSWALTFPPVYYFYMFLHSYLPVWFYIFIPLYCIRPSQWSPRGFLHRFYDPRYFAAGLENQIYHPFTNRAKPPPCSRSRPGRRAIPGPSRRCPQRPAAPPLPPPAPSRRRRGRPGPGQPGGFPGSGGFGGRPRRGVQARAVPGAQVSDGCRVSVGAGRAAAAPGPQRGCPWGERRARRLSAAPAPLLVPVPAPDPAPSPPWRPEGSVLLR